jgi:hypothetical protein
MRTEIVAGFHPNTIMGRVKYRYNIEDFCYKVKKTWEIEFGWMPPSHNVRSWQRDHMNRMFDLLFVILYHCSVNFGGFMCGLENVKELCLRNSRWVLKP